MGGVSFVYLWDHSWTAGGKAFQAFQYGLVHSVNGAPFEEVGGIAQLALLKTTVKHLGLHVILMFKTPRR
jgi:hypothetical protein